MRIWSLAFAALIFLFGFLFGAVSFAGTIAGIGANLAYERGADGRAVETRTPFSVRGGYRLTDVDLYLEYSTFRTNDGESMVSVTRDRHEFLFWARHLFKSQWQISPYLGLGVGFHFERVETSFDREINQETGDPDSVLALSAGVLLPLTRYFEVSMESRVAMASRYSPNPTWGLGAAVGVRF